ncbi:MULTISPECIES: DUF6221 family protein [Streptomyces]|uniref:DUF6221 family protein n=1 Tax=Streptomyces TaxID=1883 RepID=UPI000E023110|nr:MULTISPECIES: DUF6221 family protein [Streptomyces]MBT3077622.1 hypothetical protein [Streptomyces sp. COG21]MBT3084468.1 hypothetical protein [Streptomyces sp. COG20]MBT3085375.1 hypothetical protein [Streptomyces sp. CYG21]MBT3098967.1 hypothetical protein [Streptomyces sp. CBG30]MBT3103583.1 hypothetical protein [Streptomyces sp. COG19]
MTDALVTFVKARLDEDEQVAQAATQGEWVWSREFVTPPGYHHRTIGPLEPGDSAHIARQDPARTLREVEAKRQLLDEHQDVNDGSCGTCVDGRWGYPTHGGSSPQPYPCRTLRLLALPYSDHTDYQEKWGL